MERTTVNTIPSVQGKVRWQKVGGGSFRMGNKIIKPGEKFWAFPSEIPKPFRDVVIALDPSNVVFEEEKKKAGEPTKQVEGKKATFTAKQREGSQWWDVFDGQEKKLNEKGLSKEKADKLVEDLLK